MIRRRCGENDERHRTVWNTGIVERHCTGLHCHIRQRFIRRRPASFADAGASLDPASFKPKTLLQFGICNTAVWHIMTKARHTARNAHRAPPLIMSAAASIAS